jgi:hypothetical protein
MGKGSSPRPYSIGQKEFGNNYDTIFGKKPPKEQYVPPALPSEANDNQSKQDKK